VVFLAISAESLRFPSFEQARFAPGRLVYRPCLPALLFHRPHQTYLPYRPFR